jgi:predicted DNA-binding transcriptional regulator YafY
MQNSVLFGIVITLLGRNLTSRSYLARKYEVSERTVSRYIDTLCAAGIPIGAIYGPNGGYYITSEYKIDKTYFTKEELRAIISSLKATSVINDSLSNMIIDKFEHLSRRNSETSDYVIKNDTLVIDAASWTNPEIFRNRIDVINKAIYSGKTVNISYVDRYNALSERDLDPYAVALKEGVWYVYGWYHKREDFRLFKLSRIRNIRLTDKDFTRKETDVYQALKGHFDPDTLVSLEFEFSSLIYDEILEWLGNDAIEDAGTKYLARTQIYGGKTLISKLMSFGSSIRVLSPKSVNRELIEENRRMLRNALRNGDIDESELKNI